MSCIEVGVSGRSFCRLTRTWPNRLGSKDARAVVACTVPTTREHRGAAPDHLPEEYRCRFSFCCDRDGCRKRMTPPSVRFLGRKVYLGAVVILISAMRQGPTPRRVRELSTLFGVDRATIARWQAFWRDHIPQTPFWKVARARLVPVVDIVVLPLSLLEAFLRTKDPCQDWGHLLRFLSPLTIPGGPLIEIS